MSQLPPFPTERRRLAFGELVIEIDTITDSEALLDELIARGPNDADYRDEVLPYWADLWHSALALGQVMERSGDKFRDRDVIELGCGLGLPGIVTSLLGGRITFSDYVSEALAFARHNLALNVVDDAARFERLDWRNPITERRYDFVIAADVAYEERFFRPLYDTFARLSAPGGEVWLTEPGRPIAESFLSGLSDEGWRLLETETIPVKLDGVVRRVNFLRLATKA